MAPSATLVRDSPASRWFRRSAPFWILLGIALLAAMPGMLVGQTDRDAADESTRMRPVDHLALPDDPDPRLRQMTASEAAR